MEVQQLDNTSEKSVNEIEEQIIQSPVEKQVNQNQSQLMSSLTKRRYNSSKKEDQYRQERYKKLGHMFNIAYEDAMTLSCQFQCVGDGIFYKENDKTNGYAYITSTSWGDIPAITLYKKKNDMQNVPEKLVINTFYGTTAFLMSKNDLQKLYQFHIQILGDLYCRVPQAREKLFYSLEDKLPENKYYLIAPSIYDNELQNWKIDWGFIDNFLNFKQENSINENTETLYDVINELQNDKDKLNQYLTENLFESINGTRPRYFVIDVIYEPDKLSANDYIDYLMKYCTGKTKEQVLKDSFQISQEEIDKLSMNDLLFEANTQLDTIQSYRKTYKNSSNNSTQIDRCAPVVICNQMLIAGCFDLITPNKAEQSPASCKRDIVQLKGISTPIVPSQKLRKYPFNVKKMDLFVTIPSIAVYAERYLIANEMNLYYDLCIKTEYLVEAQNCSSYSSEINYEVLEVVGDSCLKFIAALNFFLKYPDVDEGILSHITRKHVGNFILMVHGIKSELLMFIRSQLKNISDWNPPFQKEDKRKFIEHKISGNQIADSLEAVVAAAFLSHETLEECVKFLHRIQLPCVDQLLSVGQIISEKAVIPEKYFQDIKNNLDTNMTMKQIYQLKLQIESNPKKSFSCNKHNFQTPRHLLLKNKRKNISSQTFGVMNYFTQNQINITLTQFKVLQFHNIKTIENSVLGYTFKNKFLLLQALCVTPIQFEDCTFRDHQNLEFLGDALIECFVMSNVYCQLLKRANPIKLTPCLMQQVKITLLSNSFMARACVLMGLHKYILEPKQENDVKKFLEKVNFNIPFVDFVKHRVVIPKVLSDIFEAIAGAIIVDGGMKAFQQVFGRIYAPFIYFVSNHIEKIQTNVTELFLNTVIKRGDTPRIALSHEKTNYEEFVYEAFVDEEKVAEGKGPKQKIAKERAAYQACLKLGFL